MDIVDFEAGRLKAEYGRNQLMQNIMRIKAVKRIGILARMLIMALHTSIVDPLCFRQPETGNIEIESLTIS